MYGEQQRRSALREGVELAQLDPAARGAAMTYAYFPLEVIMQQIPTSLLINPMTVAMVAGITSISCGFAYWLAEDKSL